MTVLKVENLVKNYKNIDVINNVSFEVEEGEILAIIGASGSGKSTLLRCINQLERINSGNIIIGNDSMIKECKKGKVVYQNREILEKMNLECGMVFQNFNLFPHLSILDNVTEAMTQGIKMKKPEAEKKAMEILKDMGIEEKASEYPCNLSGGQQQRVSIARSLAIDPKILFMDEPTSALDPELISEVLKVIKKLAKEKRTMVIVTHEIMFAKEIADRIIYMDKGEIIEEGTPMQVIDNPRKERTKEFLKRYLSN